MSTSQSHSPSGSGVEQDRRAQKLASARKKLQKFRASQSSLEHTHSTHPSASHPAPPAKTMPLTTEASINAPAHERTPSKGKAKEMFAEPPSPTRLAGSEVPGMAGPAGTAMAGHRHRRSDSQAHRRQRSSLAIPAGTPLAQGLLRPSPVEAFPVGAFGTAQPSGIITTPPTPMMQAGLVPAEARDECERGGEEGDDEEDREQVAARLSAFTFGAKPVRGATFPPKRRQGSISSTQGLFADVGVPPSTSPLGSPTSPGRFSTPSSRPPSLLLTRPTPKMFDSPTSSGPSFHSTPSSPPTPVRKKRHSHTRSNSISLPNLKLGNASANPRPTSLGVPTSPGFSSPVSPTSANGDIPARSRFSGPIAGQRLKFEPSGRGAEAEKEREESRRKALEKLTGGASSPNLAPRSPVVEAQIAEISLPDLDDEDTSSIASASSGRPLSGAFSSGSGSSSSFFFSGGHSSFTVPSLSGSTASTPSTLSASPSSWASPTSEERSPSERWSGSSFGLQKEFGSGVGKDDGGVGGFGMDLGTAMAKRPAISRQLSALAEVDESEEDDVGLDGVPEEDEEDEAEAGEEMAHEMSPDPEPAAPEPVVPEALVSPTNGLRELRLSSSISMPRGETPSSADSVRTFTFPRGAATSPNPAVGTQGPPSPTKSYGTIGRGRPEGGTTGATVTPKNPTARRRPAPSSGSRGSSISYRKDEGASSTSSRDLSGVGRAGMRSPPLVMSPTAGMGAGMGGMGVLGSPTKIGRWATASAIANARGAARPCPRPKALAGVSASAGGEGGTSGRVLGEVDEEEEGSGSGFGVREMPISPFEASTSPAPHAHPHAQAAPTSARRYSTFSSEGGGRASSEISRDSFGERMQWRDVQLEMERERESLRDEVDVWKRRCKVLEERLDAEKKEGSVLRDRVRKLGDRLSSVSSVPTERRTADSQAHAASSRLIAEMRDQLFTLTASLEHERRAKDHAVAKLGEAQRQLQAGAGAGAGRQGSVDESEEEELLLTARPDEGGFPSSSPFFPAVGSAATTPSLEAAPITEPEKAAEEPADLNLARMKGWGFPKDAPAPTPRERKRESFFGLSNVLRRTTSAEEETSPAAASFTGLGVNLPPGVDLPPFIFDESSHAHSGVVLAQRAVSDPTLSFSDARVAITSTIPLPAAPSASQASHSGSAPGMFSFGGYMSGKPSSEGREREPRKMTKRREYPPMIESVNVSSEGSGGRTKGVRAEMPLPGVASTGMDFRKGCKCCVGQVIEV
ncbi:hypothetical protein IAT38_002620 [Cryptococcus sp. DSM 104549]